MKGNYAKILKNITGKAQTHAELTKEVNFLNQFYKLCAPSEEELDEQVAKVESSAATVSSNQRTARIDAILYASPSADGTAAAPKSVEMWKEFINDPSYTSYKLTFDKKTKTYIAKDTKGRLSYEALNERYKKVETEKDPMLSPDEVTLAQSRQFDTTCESFYLDCYRRCITDNLDEDTFKVVKEARSMNALVTDCKNLVFWLLPEELASKCVLMKKEIRVFGLIMTRATKDTIMTKGKGWGNYWFMNAIKCRLNNELFNVDFGNK